MPELPAVVDVHGIARAAAYEHFVSLLPAGAEIAADRLAAGIAAGYARATPKQRSDWTSLGQEALRAAAVMVARLGLNPDPGAQELYIFPRGGQLIVSPTPRGVRTMFEAAGLGLEIFLCGPHDADGIDVRAGRVISFAPGRQPLDWVATPSTCIGVRVFAWDKETGEPVLDRWLPTSTIERRRASGGNGKPWSENWDEMATKTGQLYALKYAPAGRINSAVIEAAAVEWDYEQSREPVATERRTVSVSAPALTAQTIPESRQLPAPTEQPATVQRPAAPAWVAVLKAPIEALAAAMGRKTGSLGEVKALLADVGIDPTAPNAAELIEDARVAALERG